MFGALRAVDPQGIILPITHFRTQRSAALLAYLAFYIDRQHSREELSELLWPDSDPVVARTRLRQEIATLRRHMEPAPRIVPGSVIETTGRELIGLRKTAVQTDVQDFERLLGLGAYASANVDPPTLSHAIALHGTQGLLSGRYEPWIFAERERLAAIYAGCLADLAKLTTQDASQKSAQRVDLSFRAVAAARDDEDFDDSPARRRSTSEQTATPARPMASGNRPTAEPVRRESNATDAQEPTSSSQFLPPALAPNPLLESDRVDATAVRSQAEGFYAEPVPHLPRPLTRFFGRERELEELFTLANGDAGSRLITVTGPGGSGKTRLAVELAQFAHDSFAGNAFVVAGFVPLAAVTDESRLTENAAAALFPQLPASGDDMTLDGLAHMLMQRGETVGSGSPKRKTLVILDNFEQIAVAGSAWVDELLRKAPSVVLIVTSRQALRTEGEQEYPLAPLPLLENEADPTVASVSQTPSAALFADRAAFARPDFRITRRNAADVADVCRLLDGIPLALEIAAARIAQFGPSRMRKELSADLFGVLVSRRRDAEDRHRTLHATIAWSVGLLPADLQRFFTRLAVFHDGWTAEAAAQVAGDDAPERAAERLQLLCDHSLITSETDSFTGDTRFRMLETLRAFAADQLTPEQRNAAEMNHLNYYARVAWESDEELKGPNQSICRHRLFVEKLNLRAAFAKTGGQAEVQIARATLAAGLVEFWRVDDIVEGRRWMEEALPIAELPPGIRARLLVGIGHYAGMSGDVPGRNAAFAEALDLLSIAEDNEATIDLLVNWADNLEAVEKGRVLSSQFGMRRLQALALGSQATEKAYGGFKKEAIEGFQAARHLFAECKDLIGFQGILVEESYHRARWGDFSIAASLMEENLGIAAAARHGERTSHTAWHRLASIRRLQGRYDVAHELVTRAETFVRRQGWSSALADSLLYKARVYLDIEQIDSARACAQERDRLVGQPSPLNSDRLGCLLYAQLSLAEGDKSNAKRQATASISAFGDDPYGGWRAIARIFLGRAEFEAGDIPAARTAFQDAVRDAATAGNRWIVVEAIETVAHAAAAEKSEQSFKFAAFLIAFATAEREKMGIVLSTYLRLPHEAALNSIRASLAPEIFDSAWHRGSRSTLARALRHLKLRQRPKP